MTGPRTSTGSAGGTSTPPGDAAPGPRVEEPRGRPADGRALRSQGRKTMRKLLDAAVQAFDQRGYHATRINDVVEIAQTSHGTFYLYFANKEDILRALVAEALADSAELNEMLAAPPDGDVTWDELRQWVDHFSRVWTRYAPLFRLWTDLVHTDREFGNRVRHALASLSDTLADIIQRWGVVGVDPKIASLAMFAMLDRFHSLRRSVGDSVDDADLDALTTLLYRGLVGGDGKPSASRQRRNGTGRKPATRQVPATTPAARRSTSNT